MNPHGAHCYDRDRLLICGWPDMHPPSSRTVHMRPSGVEAWPDYDYLDGTMPGPLTRRLADARKTRESAA